MSPVDEPFLKIAPIEVGECGAPTYALRFLRSRTNVDFEIPVILTTRP